MKPGVAITILAPRLKPDTLQLVHYTTKDGTRAPLYLKDFDAGLAHGWTIVQHDHLVRIVEQWLDLDNWTEFALDEAVTMDDIKIKVERMAKELEQHRNQANLGDILQTHAFQIDGGRPS
jgi:hypothetical protein